MSQTCIRPHIAPEARKLATSPGRGYGEGMSLPAAVLDLTTLPILCAKCWAPVKYTEHVHLAFCNECGNAAGTLQLQAEVARTQSSLN
jgi:hypothetical protein